MLLKEFPDIQWLKDSIQQNFSAKRSWDGKLLPDSGWPTAILNVKSADVERKDIKGPFSLFLNLQGESKVTCDGKIVPVSADTFVISNSGQHYDLTIENQDTETFNIHFGEQFYRDTLYSLNHSSEQLLDDIHPLSQEWNIPIKSNFRNHHFNSLMQSVKEGYNSDESESHLYNLLSYLLVENEKQLKHIEDLSSTKKSTKLELLNRVYLAVDFIHAHYNKPISIDDLANVSMLSKFHFLRVFKSIFRLSPHQYIKKIRLEKAIELLKKTSLPLYLVAEKVGIENGSSLSRMIYQTTGKRPSTIAN